MRKFAPYLFASLIATVAFGEEPKQAETTTSEKHSTQVGQARLGLSIRKPDETITSQLPGLPSGIGFVVTDVEKDGPADKAGIRKLDIFWKMNDQMIVNEGQLATLLRIAVPGDEVAIAVFREGKLTNINLVLGEGAQDSGNVIVKSLNDSVIRQEDEPLTIVNVENKSAHVSLENGTAEIKRSSVGDFVQITDKEGNVVFEGLVSGKPEHSTVPDGWRREVCALRRGLDHASSAEPAPLRLPRPRIVLPPKEAIIPPKEAPASHNETAPEE